MSIASMSGFVRSTALVLGVSCLLLLSFPASGQVVDKQRQRRVNPDQQPSAAPADKSAEEVDEGDVVRVETQLVSVPAVVTNSSGRPLTGLRAENFLLFENGQQQKIANFATTEAPFEIALL